MNALQILRFIIYNYMNKSRIPIDKRLIIYEKMKIFIENQTHTTYSFCHTLNLLASTKVLQERYFVSELPELYKHRPKNRNKWEGPYWFNLRDKQTRLNILNKEIDNIKELFQC